MPERIHSLQPGCAACREHLAQAAAPPPIRTARVPGFAEMSTAVFISLKLLAHIVHRSQIDRVGDLKHWLNTLSSRCTPPKLVPCFWASCRWCLLWVAGVDRSACLAVHRGPLETQWTDTPSCNTEGVLCPGRARPMPGPRAWRKLHHGLPGWGNIEVAFVSGFLWATGFS